MSSAGGHGHNNSRIGNGTVICVFGLYADYAICCLCKAGLSLSAYMDFIYKAFQLVK